MNRSQFLNRIMAAIERNPKMLRGNAPSVIRRFRSPDDTEIEVLGAFNVNFTQEQHPDDLEAFEALAIVVDLIESDPSYRQALYCTDLQTTKPTPVFDSACYIARFGHIYRDIDSQLSIAGKQSQTMALALSPVISRNDHPKTRDITQVVKNLHASMSIWAFLDPLVMSRYDAYTRKARLLVTTRAKTAFTAPLAISRYEISQLLPLFYGPDADPAKLAPDILHQNCKTALEALKTHFSTHSPTPLTLSISAILAAGINENLNPIGSGLREDFLIPSEEKKLNLKTPFPPSNPPTGISEHFLPQNTPDQIDGAIPIPPGTFDDDVPTLTFKPVGIMADTAIRSSVASIIDGPAYDTPPPSSFRLPILGGRPIIVELRPRRSKPIRLAVGGAGRDVGVRLVRWPVPWACWCGWQEEDPIVTGDDPGRYAAAALLTLLSLP